MQELDISPGGLYKKGTFKCTAWFREPLADNEDEDQRSQEWPAEPCRARSPKNYCLLSGQETSVPRATLPWPQSGSCQDQKLQLVTPEPHCPCCDLSQRHGCPRGCSQTHKPGPRHQPFPCRPLLATEMQRQEHSVHLAPSFQTSREGI